jgi:hypothetical protein
LTVKRASRSALYIAGVPLPEDLETRHAALIGSTGSGKTTALRQLLDGIERRGDSAIVYDTSGEFVAHYYDPARGDVILNPFDQRGAFWNPFDEIAHPADADRIAAQLISAKEDNEGDVWTSTARLLVANIMRALWRESRGDLPSLLTALQATSKADLKVWLAGSSSARTFEDDADRASGSVLFMLSEAVNLLQYLRAAPGLGGTFSFRAFFEGLDQIQGPKPWIFVPRKEDYFEATKPLLACWLECAAGAMLGLDPHPRRRVWMMLDELPDIPKVDNLQRLLPQGRKFGAAVVLTFQAIGQMRNRYGKDGAEALLGCANTKLFLQLIDADSRKWASQTVGEVEIEMRGTTESLALEVGKGRTSLGSQRQIRAALIESEFRLPRHEGFLQLPDALPVAAHSVEQSSYPQTRRAASAWLRSRRGRRHPLGHDADAGVGTAHPRRRAGLMVATISGISSSSQAASYYEADDYYSEGGLAPSAWQGKGAEALDLEGPVDRDQFKALLDGLLPSGQALGTVRNGEREHRPGWDLTFSAPKSVSVMALVAGDKRLISAHDQAAATALAFAERLGPLPVSAKAVRSNRCAQTR